MSELSVAELNLRIAEFVGDEGFYPADTCPQGHSNVDPDDGWYSAQIHGLCLVCTNNWIYELPDGTDNAEYDHRELEAIDHANDLSWHPEWRIGRGKPKPYAESLDLLVPVVAAWCRRLGFQFVLRQRDGWFMAEMSFLVEDMEFRFADREAEAAAESLARSFVAARGTQLAMEREAGIFE